MLTRLMCSPTSDGSAACVLASEAFVRRNGLESQAVEIVGLEMATDVPSSFNENSMMKMVGYEVKLNRKSRSPSHSLQLHFQIQMTKIAAQKLFVKTNFKPQDVDVIELHDCFAGNFTTIFFARIANKI